MISKIVGLIGRLLHHVPLNTLIQIYWRLVSIIVCVTAYPLGAKLLSLTWRRFLLYKNKPSDLFSCATLDPMLSHRFFLLIFCQLICFTLRWYLQNYERYHAKGYQRIVRRFFALLYLHYNVAFTFKWYGNHWNKTFRSQRIWIGYNIELTNLVHFLQDSLNYSYLSGN